MGQVDFHNTFCGKLLFAARRAIWHCFLTFIIILLLFLLATPSDTAAAVMAEFRVGALCVTGAIIAICCYGFDCIVGNYASWASLLGTIAGIASSATIMLYNESALRQIGTYEATGFIYHFGSLYLTSSIASIVMNLFWPSFQRWCRESP